MPFWISAQECRCSDEMRATHGQVTSDGNVYCKSCRKRIGPIRERPADGQADTPAANEPAVEGPTITAADLAIGRHTAWVKRVEQQVSVSADGEVMRALIVSIKGSRGPLWVAGPNARLPKAQPVLRLESDAAFDQLKAALQPERSSVTWWERGGIVSQLIVRSWISDARGDGASLGVGVGVVFPIE